jgi:hypothetical protein
MRPLHKITQRLVNGLGITLPLDTTKQSTELLPGGLLLVLVVIGLALSSQEFLFKSNNYCIRNRRHSPGVVSSNLRNARMKQA